MYTVLPSLFTTRLHIIRTIKSHCLVLLRREVKWRHLTDMKYALPAEVVLKNVPPLQPELHEACPCTLNSAFTMLANSTLPLREPRRAHACAPLNVHLLKATPIQRIKIILLTWMTFPYGFWCKKKCIFYQFWLHMSILLKSVDIRRWSLGHSEPLSQLSYRVRRYSGKEALLGHCSSIYQLSPITWLAETGTRTVTETKNWTNTFTRIMWRDVLHLVDW